MEKATTIRFIGRLAEECPDMLIKAQQMASGNVIAWVDASIKIVGAVGDVVNLCLNKNNTKLIKQQIENIESQEIEIREKTDHNFLLAKRKFISSLKEQFKNNRKELQEIYSKFQTNQYEYYIKRGNEIQRIVTDIRKNLKELIDFYDSELLKVISTNECSYIEKHQIEECKRLLHKQFNENIDI